LHPSLSFTIKNVVASTFESISKFFDAIFKLNALNRPVAKSRNMPEPPALGCPSSLANSKFLKLSDFK
jgi:hypothetical protein